uniref:RING-CH-type domain-containing protein n=1 Tax=Strigamia maritima TaxID=126957 RepID=T1JJY6_STRMM
MADVENQDQESQSSPHNRQIQVRIIQIAPRTRENRENREPFFPDPADLLLQDGATATANIIRSATSLPIPNTVHTREIRLNQASNITYPHSTSASQDIPEHSEGTPAMPHDQSNCRCHVMRMADNTILWFVVNDVETESHQHGNSSRRPPILETPSSVRASDSGPFCRICFLGAEEGPLLRVCHCRGTVGMVHHRCVLMWTMQRQSYSCEICHYAYNLQVNGLRWCWRVSAIEYPSL